MINASTRSLRGRYFTAAVLLALLIVASAVGTGVYVASVTERTDGNIALRYRLLAESRQVRDSVWEADFALQSYMLSPDRVARERVGQRLRNARVHLDHLIDDSRSLPDLHDELLSVKDEIVALSTEATHLMHLRVDPDTLYPAMRLARSSMLEMQTQFYTESSLALHELVDEQGYGSKAYRLLSEVRYGWSQTIAAYRLYLINRIASLAESRLGAQADDVEVLYEGVEKNLRALAVLANAGKLGLQSTESVAAMREAADKWHAEFLQVKQINRTDYWRSDVPILKHAVEPLIASIWQHLKTIDTRLETSVGQDVTVLVDMARYISQTFWVLAAVALVFIAVGFRFFDRLVLRPISELAEALRNEARGKGGTRLPRVNTRETRHLIEAFAEMRRQVRNRQHELEYQAHHDALTNLPNRTLLQERLAQRIESPSPQQTGTALMIMDLDRFKEINDTLGHQTGDQVLQQVGERLCKALRETDTVARLGGDEFALLLPDVDEDEAKAIAEKLLAALESSFQISRHNLYVGASIGIALYPRHGSDVQTLVQRADVAMYNAKRRNSGYAVYALEQDQYTIGRLSLVADLRQAINQDQLSLHFQPKLDIKSGAVRGAEALLRWHHPERGLIPLEQIVPIAEQTGLIKSLTLWVLDEALRQNAYWREVGLDLHVAVNISVWNLHDPDLDTHIRARLEQWGIPENRLILEITESAMMADPAHAMDMLLRLDAMGVHLAVDDFGTGFSSLSYLKRFPVSELKIDKSFVMDMMDDENDAVIVRSTIDLAHNLGLRVVAEGVESKDILDMLYILGCDTAQGYHFSRPLPSEELLRWIRAGETAPALKLVR